MLHILWSAPYIATNKDNDIRVFGAVNDLIDEKNQQIIALCEVMDSLNERYASLLDNKKI